MIKDYNTVYEKLVTKKTDFCGMIAYSIYKREKREVIRKNEDIEAFIVLKTKRHELDRYRKEAQILIDKYSQDVADEEFDRIKKDLSNSISKISYDNIYKEKLLKKFLKWLVSSSFGGFLGNLLTIIMAIAAFYMLSGFMIDLKEFLMQSLTNTVNDLK